MLPLTKVSWKPFLNEQVIKRLKCKQASKTQAALSQNEPEIGCPSVPPRVQRSFIQMLLTLFYCLRGSCRAGFHGQAVLQTRVPWASRAVDQSPSWMGGLPSAMHSKTVPEQSWLFPCSLPSPFLVSDSSGAHWVSCSYQSHFSFELSAGKSTDNEWEWDSQNPQWFVLLCCVSPGQILIFHVEVHQDNTRVAAVSIPSQEMEVAVAKHIPSGRSFSQGNTTSLGWNPGLSETRGSLASGCNSDQISSHFPQQMQVLCRHTKVTARFCFSKGTLGAAPLLRQPVQVSACSPVTCGMKRKAPGKQW